MVHAYGYKISAVGFHIGVVENSVDRNIYQHRGGEYFSYRAINLIHIIRIAFH